eukprot:gnl/MRDRNA2_/MRDRNA2_127148_c0_seq1.p1 gnl/MRDRNA2_/MRDRNA2_127148_c0~~gnl/MRDRNA2_/MRDRNA2_127148_c0_seq1.p1  ORF type:complete len:1105 (+),score=338.16 gnl/MRDRNA2_/MRDRNA2_127148_c0_seq1:69-3383(+)
MDYNWIREKAAQAQEAAKAAAERAAEEAAKAAADVQAAAKEHARDIAANTQGIAEGILSGDFLQEEGDREVEFAEGPLGFNLQGATVLEIDPAGQAGQLGIQPGDSMVSIAGEPLPPLPEDCGAEGEKKMKLLIQRRIKAQPRPVRMCFSRGSTTAKGVHQVSGVSDSRNAVASSGSSESLLERIRILEIEKTREADRALALDSKLTQARNDLSEAQEKARSDLSEAQEKAQQDLGVLKERARDACNKLKEECRQKLDAQEAAEQALVNSEANLSSLQRRLEHVEASEAASTQELHGEQPQVVVNDATMAFHEGKDVQDRLIAAENQLEQRLHHQESEMQTMQERLVQEEARVQQAQQQVRSSEDPPKEDQDLENTFKQRLEHEECVVQDLKNQLDKAEEVMRQSQEVTSPQVDDLRDAEGRCSQQLRDEQAVVLDLRNQIQQLTEQGKNSEDAHVAFETRVSSSEAKVKEQYDELIRRGDELSKSQELCGNLRAEIKDLKAFSARDTQELGELKGEIAEALKRGGDSAAALGLKETQLRFAEDKIKQEEAKTEELRDKARAALTRAREGAQSGLEAEQEELRKSQDELGAAQALFREFQGKLTKSETEINTLKDALEKEQEENDTARWAADAKISGLTDQLSRTKSELGAEVSEVQTELGSELAAAQKRFADTDSGRKSAATKAAGLEQGLQKALSEMKAHQDQAQKLTVELDNLKAENREHQFSAAHRDTAVKGAQAVLERRAQSLEEQLEQSHGEHKAAGLEVDSLTTKLLDSERRCSELQSDLESQAKLATELSDLREEHAVLSNQEVQAASALAQTKQEITSVMAQREEVQAQVHSLSHASSNADDQCASLRKEVESANAAKAAAEQACEEARAMMKDFRESAAVAQESEASHRQLIKSLQRELGEAREETNKVKNKLEKVQTELATTRDQLEAAHIAAAAAPTIAPAPPQDPSPSAPSPSVAINVGEGEDLATEAIMSLRMEISDLKKQNASLQKQLDAKPITFTPSEEDVANMEREALQRRPVWEQRLRVTVGPVAKKADGGLRILSHKILKSQALHLVFWAHLFILYTISASCIVQEAPDPSNCAEEFMKRAGAAT